MDQGDNIPFMLSHQGLSKGPRIFRYWSKQNFIINDYSAHER